MCINIGAQPHTHTHTHDWDKRSRTNNRVAQDNQRWNTLHLQLRFYSPTGNANDWTWQRTRIEFSTLSTLASITGKSNSRQDESLCIYMYVFITYRANVMSNEIKMRMKKYEEVHRIFEKFNLSHEEYISYLHFED